MEKNQIYLQNYTLLLIKQNENHHKIRWLIGSYLSYEKKIETSE